jgi:hypothetical protein
MQPRNKLNSLHIRRFRTFDDLKIPRLTNVTLIVGANSIGKTSVLEALRLYFSQGETDNIYQLLSSRNEYSYSRVAIPDGGIDYYLALQSLFYGRPSFKSSLPSFSIGPIEEMQTETTLSISLTYLREEVVEADSSIRLRRVKLDELVAYPDATLGLRISSADRNRLVRISRLNPRVSRRPNIETTTGAVYLSSSGLELRELARQWDAIALTDDEQLAIEALGAMSDRIEKLVLVENPNNTHERVMMAKTAHFSEPVPIKSLGEITFSVSCFLSFKLEADAY